MIALSSPSLSLLPVGEAMEKVAAHFRGWEIVGEGRHFLPEIEQELARLLPSYDLRCSVHAPLSDVNLGSLNPRMLQASLKEVIDSVAVAGRLGLGPFTVHPGFYTPLGQSNRPAAWNATKDSLRQIERVAQEHGVQVALENMPAMPISMIINPEQMEEMLAGTKLGICFDIGHAHTTHNLESYLRLQDRFVNLHVHDNEGHYDQHLPLGKGKIPLARLLPLNGYRGWYVVEAKSLEEGRASAQVLEQLLR